MSSENKVETHSTSKSPRAIVTINGIVAKFIELTIESNTYYISDTFSLELPIEKQTKELNLQYFATQQAFMVEVFIGFPKDINNYNITDLESMLLAQADSVEVDYLQGKIIMSGRDLTAKFIDNKTTNKFPNLTASQIVTQLAEKEGLTASVTETNVPAGVFYANSQSTLTSEQPEWDLITFLAQSEEFSAYVKGTTLYFHPKPTEKDIPYLLQYNKKTEVNNYGIFTGMSLNCERSMTVSRDVQVTVRSWNSSSKKAFTVVVKSSLKRRTPLAKAAQPIGETQNYSYIFPGLTHEQALQKAQLIARQLTQHERIIRANLPGDNILNKVSVIKLTGTETDYDQVYFPSAITRKLSPTEYTMEISAKNHSPTTEVTV